MSSAIKTADDLLSMVKCIDPAAIAYEHKKLVAIKKWALDHLGVDYGVGDRVQIKDGYRVREFLSDGHKHGWWPYRDCLVPGAVATVQDIDFNEAHGYWYAVIVLDREFSTCDLASEFTHYWHGPVAETPDGMAPPSKYDQECHPDGRKHTWWFSADQLERVGSGGQKGGSDEGV